MHYENFIIKPFFSFIIFHYRAINKFDRLVKVAGSSDLSRPLFFTRVSDDEPSRTIRMYGITFERAICVRNFHSSHTHTFRLSPIPTRHNIKALGAFYYVYTYNMHQNRVPYRSINNTLFTCLKPEQ